MLEHRLAGHHEAIVWPDDTAGVPHEDPRFLIAYMPLEFGGQPRAWQEEKAKEFFEKYGDKPRKHRNGLGLAIPSEDQIQVLRRSVRYFVAIEHVKAKAKQLNLTDEQKSQLRERESTEKAAVESAFLKLYMEVWFPRMEEGRIVIESVAVGGRPLQTTLSDKKEAAVHERVLELIAQVQPRVFRSLKARKIVELFKLDEGKPPCMGIPVTEVVEGFFSFLGFTRLLSANVVRKAVARGIAEETLGYFSGPPPTLGDGGKFAVAPEKVRFSMSVADDEIDLDTGFIMLPAAVPQPVPPVVCPKCGKSPCQCAQPPEPCLKCGKYPCVCAQPPVCPKCGERPCVCTVPPAVETEKVVQISFSADRNALFNAWNAAANLADMAGRVNVTLHAESEQGFDKGKLQNGVMEPLREADLIE